MGDCRYMSLAPKAPTLQYSATKDVFSIGAGEVAMLRRTRLQRSSSTILLALGLASLPLTSCNSLTKCATSSFGCNPIFLVSIQISPADSSITVGSTQQLKAVGKWDDGSTGDITSSVNWASSETSLVTINSSGLATTHTIGRPKITAATPDGSVSSSTHLIIIESAGTATPRYAYVTNLSDDTLSIYSVNPSTGQLRPRGYILTGSHPDSICLHP